MANGNRVGGSSPRTWGTASRHLGRLALNAVHPHARGEQMPGTGLVAATSGSSPRTWGTGRDGRSRTAVDRFIPTHVGNRAPACKRMPPQSVHPHARGEQGDGTVLGDGFRGSSPRTWGTAGYFMIGWAVLRFIPTHVGNSCCRSCYSSPQPVHPHARGEQFGNGLHVQLERRFIPTHVGNRTSSIILFISLIGSSPRTWGTDKLEVPSRAGRAVHPHARGEQLRYGVKLAEDAGSSPRTWGTDRAAGVRAAVERFIPTHVGNSGAFGVVVDGDTVHPHARGEQMENSTVSLLAYGSSPRTWGTATIRGGSMIINRFIPTHVGNSQT